MNVLQRIQHKSHISAAYTTAPSRFSSAYQQGAPARVSPSSQLSQDHHMQSKHGTPLQYSLSNIPIFPERDTHPGLPNMLKASIENLSGMPMHDVEVHYNSFRPAHIHALAYTQGTQIHLGPGQERHLAHEAWHVVQQKQGRVRPTLQAMGMAINDTGALEQEAEEMGTKALHMSTTQVRTHGVQPNPKMTYPKASAPVIQGYNIKYGALQNDCGTDMRVWINGKSDSDLGKGSKPSVTPSWWPKPGTQLATYFSTYIVQGHLLNDNLGGPGNTMANLTPITKSTNSTHFKKVEADVKDEVLKHDHVVEYHVYADYTSNPLAKDLDPAPPAGTQAYLNNMAGTIGADYTSWEWDAGANKWKKVGGLAGDLLIKNEGKSLKGAF